MKIRREPTLTILLRLVSLLTIVKKSRVDKMFHPFSPSVFATANRRGQNRVIDRKLRKRSVLASKQVRLSRRPLLQNLRSNLRPAQPAGLLERRRLRRTAQMIRQRLLQKSPKRVRRRK